MKRIIQQINKTKAIIIFLFAFLLFAAGTTNAQIGIGIANPATSAQLDVSSTTKGFLPPRMSMAQRNAIVSPTAGLTIWCKDCGVLGELQVYNGATWTNMTGGYSALPIQPTTAIGTQTWMTRNLDVTTYRNGDPIPEVKDAAQWANLTTGAWCYYNNDPALGAIYGKLYNRAAIVDPRGLAPEGWHIPSDSYSIIDGQGPPEGGAEWKTLGLFLGAENVFTGEGGATVAGKMIATSLWNSPGSGATNESGFTGLPGGQRNPDGSFSSIGDFGRWWSTGEYRETSGHSLVAVSVTSNYVSIVLNSNAYNIGKIKYRFSGENPVDGVFDYTYPAGFGLSVRCVKDPPPPTVIIGSQVWMQKNLDVSRYRNGDPIPQVTNQAQWDTTHTGAWCYYNNDPANGLKYGKLYNWYAVKDPRGLAPAGWHIPSDGEVTILRNYLGGINVAGGKMKDTGTAYWTSPNIGASNSSGFTALPGGLRYYQFYGIGTTGEWWTSTPDTGAYPYRGGNYSVGNSSTVMGIGESDPNAALSIRCIRD